MLSESSPFDIDDEVVLIRLPKNYEYGWGDEYVPGSFDKYLGKTLTIADFDSETGNFYFTKSAIGHSIHYGIPFFCLCSVKQYNDFFKGDNLD